MSPLRPSHCFDGSCQGAALLGLRAGHFSFGGMQPRHSLIRIQSCKRCIESADPFTFAHAPIFFGRIDKH
jgi:hypothetical protein